MSRVALLAGMLLTATPAWAVYQCGDTQDTCQCGKANPYPCCDNGGNCTWFAWHSACCTWGVGAPGWGNANTWAQYASVNAAYQVRSKPVVNSVSCRDLGTYGHVAFVSALNAAGTITVKEQNCWGNYGVKVSTYQPSYFSGGYIVRAGAVACNPGDGQTQSCGNCGTQSRGCSNAGTWNDWGACTDQGACAPGTEEALACGDCGTAKRSCSSSCQWSEPGACTSKADAAVSACDTGVPGACAAGAKTCVEGTYQCLPSVQPAAETCDAVDNDCNGQVDEGAGTCLPPPPPAPSTEGRATTVGTPPSLELESVRGSCSSVAGLSPLLLGLWALRRRSMR